MNNQYFNLIQPYIDKYGLIALQDGDQGDSCDHEGCFALCVRELYDQNKISLADYLLLRQRYYEIFNKLKQPKGSLSRGLVPNNWVSQSVVMSRDQWIPSITASGNMDLSDCAKFLFLGHLLHRGLLFTTNTCPNAEVVGQPGYKWQLPDITLFACWGLYIRAFKFWPLYPFLLLFDIEIVIQSLIMIHTSYFNPTDTTDVFNQLNMIIQAYRRLPTPFSWLARKILRFCKGGLLGYLNAYVTTANGSPPLGQIYQDALSGMGCK